MFGSGYTVPFGIISGVAEKKGHGCVGICHPGLQYVCSPGSLLVICFFASQQSLNESSHRTSDRLQIAFLSTAIVLTLKTSAVS